MITLKKMLCAGICIAVLSGCATFKTLDAEVPLFERILIYSGTRLDWAALENNEVAIRKFNTEPPSYPLLDLPFSFALDSLFLPLAISTEIFH